MGWGAVATQQHTWLSTATPSGKLNPPSITDAEYPSAPITHTIWLALSVATTRPVVAS